MNREAYKLANSIITEFCADDAEMKRCTDDIAMKRIKTHVLQEIKKEEQSKKRHPRGVRAAACAAAVLLVGTVFFSDEVRAAVKQISFSIGNALGISSDLAPYSEVIHTSITDGEYIVTLQEAMVTEEKLIISYTVERTDGRGSEEMTDVRGIAPLNDLYINGEKVQSAVTLNYRFINDEETVAGASAEFQFLTLHADLSQENDYEIEFCKDKLNTADYVGKFAFQADGADIFADTKRFALGQTFELPDGVTVTLEEFTTNEAEQRIFYSLSGETDYILKAETVDAAGEQAEFGMRVQSAEDGYMQNEQVIGEGRINENAESVTVTLYALKLPKESGLVGQEYEQIGESFELRF